MKFCSHCGNELRDEAVICTKCGCAVDRAYGPNSRRNQDDIPSVGLNILSFLIPLVGLILFCVYHSNSPVKAKQIGLCALIGFFIGLILQAISLVFLSLL